VIVAAAPVLFADDEELYALAELCGDERRRAHKLQLSFDLAQLADDADAEDSVSSIAFALGLDTGALEA
jgi:hypothetical protein